MIRCRELEAKLEKMLKKHEAGMQKLREDWAEAQKKNDRRSKKEVKAVRAELQKKIERGHGEVERLRVTMEELQKQRNDELWEERPKYHEMKYQKIIKDHEWRLQELDSNYLMERTGLTNEIERFEAELERLDEVKKRREQERGEEKSAVSANPDTPLMNTDTAFLIPTLAFLVMTHTSIWLFLFKSSTVF